MRVADRRRRNKQPMRWTDEAEKAVSRVPFFLRKRVRKKVEEEAGREGSSVVTLEHVQACRQRFLRNMEAEVKGYQIEACFGQSGCPNRAVESDGLLEDLELILARRNIPDFLKARVTGPLKMHHELRVSVSECPNACSRPQIVDIGLIGAVRPRVCDVACSGCGACVDVCKEDAIRLSDDEAPPMIHAERCLNCGQCAALCPTGTVVKGAQGYRFLVGGKLGRHPRLARELGGIYSKEEALKLVERCLDHYFKHNRHGERFGEILERTGIEFLSAQDAESPQQEL